MTRAADIPETPYTTTEVAALLGVSRDTVIRLFSREPGVIVIDHPETRFKRRRRTIRIPRSVFARVMRKHTIA